MLDSTVLLRKVVSLGEGHVVQMLTWLAKQQGADGSFVEHKDAIVLRNDLVRHIYTASYVKYFKNKSFNRMKNLITFL